MSLDGASAGQWPVLLVMIGSMDGAADECECPIVVEVADWLLIDGTMDNEVKSLRDKQWESEVPDQLNPHWVELTAVGESIRQAGWDQIPGWPRTSKGFRSWPRPGQLQAIRLSPRQWGLVVSALERWATVDQEHDPDSAACLRIAAAVRERFEAQGFGPVPAVRPEW